MIIEYEQKGDYILRTKQYYKDSNTLFSATIILSEDKEMKKNILISGIKSIFGRKNDESKTVTKKVNWFGVIN